MLCWFDYFLSLTHKICHIFTSGIYFLGNHRFEVRSRTDVSSCFVGNLLREAGQPDRQLLFCLLLSPLFLTRLSMLCIFADMVSVSLHAGQREHRCRARGSKCLVLLQVPKFFVPDQKFIYILLQSQTFCATHCYFRIF